MALLGCQVLSFLELRSTASKHVFVDLIALASPMITEYNSLVAKEQAIWHDRNSRLTFYRGEVQL